MDYQLPKDCPYHLKGFKHLESRSEETLCFEATLYKGTKKIASVGNTGQGGQNDLYYTDHEEQKAFEAYAEKLEPYTYEMAGESHTSLMHWDFLISLMADALANEATDRKEDKRWAKLCKESTVFRKVGDKPGHWTQIWMRVRATGAKRPLTPEEIVTHLTSKEPIALILNDLLPKNPRAWKEA